jgi:outer membrane lipoprotein carrier protein
MFTAGRKNDMLRALVTLSLLCILFHGNAAFGDEGLSHVLEGVQKRYKSLPGLHVTYTREVITRSMSMLGNQIKGDLATGRIYFSPPHFMRLEQETPDPEIIITDGDRLWWYQPEKKRVHLYPLKEFGKEIKLLSNIFQGLTSVEKNFRIKTEKGKAPGEYRIDLRPEPAWQEIDRISLTVTDEYDIRVVNISNVLGTVTRFHLSDLRREEKFKEGFFHFVVPDGVQLVQEGR